MYPPLKTAKECISLISHIKGISAIEARELLHAQGDEVLTLLHRADEVRSASFGSFIKICAISNAKSGACPERCDYCSQSVHFKTQVPVFPLKAPEEMLYEAKQAEAAGARAFSIVTSGRALHHHREIAQVCEAIRQIKKCTRLEVCASLGDVSLETLEQLKEAGLLRYHHNIETAPSFHAQIIHTHSYEDEIRVIHNAQKLSLLTCCGVIFGMGETLEQRIEMAFALKELAPDGIPLNFLDGRPGTPLAHRRDLTPLECLKLIAVFRLILPDKEIKICGGREVNLAEHQSKIFEAGADGLMSGDYLTTKGQDTISDQQMIKMAGFQILGPR